MNKRREELYKIIFEADTRAGKFFDVVLIIAILLSVVAIILESVSSLNQKYLDFFRAAEWFFTILFTIEYIFRIYSAKKRKQYIFSFYGIVDFLSIIPTYLSIVLSGLHAILIVRILRILRFFRVFKMAAYISEANFLIRALKASARKIAVFLLAVLSIVIVIGAVMYLVEGPENGFENIPVSIYWAIVTMTTVGFGDIAPQTVLGRVIASALMIIGYGVIAVPTGIVSAEISRSGKENETKRSEVK